MPDTQPQPIRATIEWDEPYLIIQKSDDALDLCCEYAHPRSRFWVHAIGIDYCTTAIVLAKKLGVRVVLDATLNHIQRRELLREAERLGVAIYEPPQEAPDGH